MTVVRVSAPAGAAVSLAAGWDTALPVSYFVVSGYYAEVLASRPIVFYTLDAIHLDYQSTLYDEMVTDNVFALWSFGAQFDDVPFTVGQTYDQFVTTDADELRAFYSMEAIHLDYLNTLYDEMVTDNVFALWSFGAVFDSENYDPLILSANPIVFYPLNAIV